MNRPSIAHATCPAGTHRGFSLVELMVSVTIGLLLLLGFTSLLVHQNSAREELEKASRQIENGRYAMEILHDDIEHAGFYGMYSPESGVTYTLPADPCVTAPGAGNSGWDTAPTSVPVPLYGYPGSASNPAAATTCGLSNYLPNTAILVIRRTTTIQTPIQYPPSASFAAATYIQASSCNSDSRTFVYGTGAGPFPLRQKDCSTFAPLSPYVVNVYYISSCDVCGKDNIPTLKLVQSGPGATPAAPVPLVEGIENMQFDYGVDSTGDGAPDTFVSAPAATSATTWQNVMAIKVSLLARNIDATPGYVDSKSYSLGTAGTVGPYACGAGGYPQPCNYKRHLYSEEVRVVNSSGRRETP